MPVASRVRATVEVLVIMGLILLIIWVVKPLDRPALDLSLRILIGVLLAASPLLHHDSLQRLGLRFDNFWRALAGVLPVSLLAAGVFFGTGYYLASIAPPGNAVVELAYYFAWALAQQYALSRSFCFGSRTRGSAGARRWLQLHSFRWSMLPIRG
jgi:hypothetical protein